MAVGFSVCHTPVCVCWRSQWTLPAPPRRAFKGPAPMHNNFTLKHLAADTDHEKAELKNIFEKPRLASFKGPTILYKLPLLATNSMSQRRRASNMPALQQHLNLGVSRDPLSFTSLEAPVTLYSLRECSTPITPADRMVHTPRYPPQLVRHDPKRTPSRKNNNCRGWRSSFSSPYESPGISTSVQTPQTPECSRADATQRVTRQIALASPLDTTLFQVPWRLSYSRTMARISSPLALEVGTSPTHRAYALMSENNRREVLASPLNIRSPSWTPSRPFIRAYLNRTPQEICFSMKV